MQQLVLCGQDTDDCTYWHDWYHCFIGESKEAAQQEYNSLWLEASYDKNYFDYHGRTIYISSDTDSDKFKVVTLQEWFNNKKSS